MKKQLPLGKLKKISWDLSEQFRLKPNYDGFVKAIDKDFIASYTTRKLMTGDPKKQLFLVLSSKAEFAKYFSSLFQLYDLPEPFIIKHERNAYLIWLVGYRYDDKFLNFILIDDKHKKNKYIISNFSKILKKLAFIHFPNLTLSISDKLPIFLNEIDELPKLDFYTLRNYVSTFKSILEDPSYREDYCLRMICHYLNSLKYGKVRLKSLFEYLMEDHGIFLTQYTLKRKMAFLNKFFDDAEFYIKDSHFYFNTESDLFIPTLYGFRKSKSGRDNSWRLYNNWVNSWGKTKSIPTLVDSYTERDVFWAMKQVLTKQKRWLITPKEIMEVEL